MLADFLNKKLLYYDEIDYTRMSRVYSSIKDKLKVPKIIHIIGTNGKGTTGRFLASALYSLGKRVGHYTSPHILNFNERIWLNGRDTQDAILNKAHQELLNILSEDEAESLSYFEYTTLLAMYIYQDVEYIVLEAGLGGEHDATAVFPKFLTLATPIAIDHEAFLGNSITQIAKTKLNAINRVVIFAKQEYPEVNEVLQELQKTRYIEAFTYDALLDSSDTQKIELIKEENKLPFYLVQNLSLAISALKYLGLEYDVKDFYSSRLFGRLSKFKENVLIDVGHNVLAAESIYQSLKPFKYTLVYNSYRDKNYKEILRILKPIIESIEIIRVDEERVESSEVLKGVVEALGIEYKDFKTIEKEKNYLVFGSFSVVEAFLKGEYE